MTEAAIHSAVCQYIRLQYPGVMFNTDLSGIRLTMGLAKKVKSLRSHRGFPDLQILEPRKGFHGLFIELKSVKIRTKKGELIADKHIREQAAIIDALNERGYHARFAIGFDQAKAIIDGYLKKD